jgi:hypothetical protein
VALLCSSAFFSGNETFLKAERAVAIGILKESAKCAKESKDFRT